MGWEAKSGEDMGAASRRGRREMLSVGWGAGCGASVGCKVWGEAGLGTGPQPSMCSAPWTSTRLPSTGIGRV
eukprot:351320-Chlamydomonas_euryale.AAC.3